MSASSTSHDELLERSPPLVATNTKCIDALYHASGKAPSFLTQPNSLNHLISNRSSLHAAALMRRKTVNFAKTVDAEVDYGYGKDVVEEPPIKRRKFQRRNSKTPAMLMAMSASLVQLDFLKDDGDKKDELKKTTHETCHDKNDDDDDDDNWDSGLEIAEELVKHLQQRRKSSLSQGP